MNIILKKIAVFTLINIGWVSITQGQTPAALPVPYDPSIKINYVREWNPSAPITDPVVVRAGTLAQVKTVTNYIDGLGRQIQTVMKRGSLVTATGASADMVSAVTYNAFGKEQFKYLPFAATATDVTLRDGLFKFNPFQQQAAFYNAQLSGQTGETNIGSNQLNFGYSQTIFESSPLNRVLENFAPGLNWSGTVQGATEIDRRSTKAKYYFNTDVDAVKIWTVEDGEKGSFGTYKNAAGALGMYSAGQLYKNITVDEKK